MANVLISVPTGDGWIHKSVEMVIDRLKLDPRHRVTVIRPTHRPSENNYHHILGDFLVGDYEFWLNIDADNPPKRNPLDLIDLDRDIIGCPTPVWNWDESRAGDRPIYWNAYKRVDGGWQEWPEKSGLQRVDAVGFGCVLFHRRIFEVHPELRAGPFLRTNYHDGRVECGTDLAFCDRASRAGVEIYAHFDYPCRHMVELDLTEVLLAFAYREVPRFGDHVVMAAGDG